MTTEAGATFAARGAPASRSILPRGPWVPLAAVLAGAGFLVLAGMLPVWGTRLLAPQYPKGLTLWVYGGRSEGDLQEINGLNHYIGMQPIDLASVPEIVLWPLLIIAAGVLLVTAVFVPGWTGRLAMLGLWLAPVGVLADIQRWLIRYGSELEPNSAIRLDPFIPLVIGPSKVWNFTIWSYPGPALGLLLVVALLATLARRAERPSMGTRIGIGVGVLVGLVVVVSLVVAPSLRPDEAAAAGPGPRAGPIDLAAMVAGAAPGSTLAVAAGTYHVRLVIDRPLTLVADGDVVIDGGGRGTVVTIAAPDVVLEGFRVRNSGGQVEEAAGIKVLADRVTLRGNTIEEAFTGIAVMGATEVTILDNLVTGRGQVTSGGDHVREAPATPPPNAAGSPDPHAGHGTGAGPGGQGDGISLWNTKRALVRGNVVEGVRDGIYLSYVDAALLDTNTLRLSRYAVHSMFGSEITVFGNDIRDNLAGLVFMYTREVLAGRNVILDHRSPATGTGVALKDVDGATLLENVIARNRTGLQAESTGNGSLPARVVRNRIAANDIGVALMASADITFGSNAFEHNLTQVLALEPGVERRNRWTEDYVGNAWSDYAGYDLAGDGFGDVPHRAGGTVSAIVARDPALHALRTTPALQVLDLAQRLWDAGRPAVVVDPAPVTTPTTGLPTARQGNGDGIAGAAWLVFGAGLLAVAGGGLRLLAHPTGSRRRGESEGAR